MTVSERADSLAATLAAATRERRVLTCALLPAPDSVADAMDVQAELCGILGGGVKGWKVAVTPIGAVAAPLLFVEQAPVQARHVDCVEVELAFRLSADLPQRAEPWTREEILDRIAAVHLGIELVSLRFAEGMKVPLPLLLADRLANDGYILGPELPISIVDEWGEGNASTLLTVIKNGVAIFDGCAKHQNIDPLSPLVAYASQQNDRMGGLRRGAIITTGHLCGLLDVEPGDTIVLTFAGEQCVFSIGNQ